ncbi:hypothetical protein AAMO2058_000413900 [Amorphochlora amoebiformis]
MTYVALIMALVAPTASARRFRGLTITFVHEDLPHPLHPVVDGAVTPKWDNVPPYFECPDVAEVRFSLNRVSLVRGYINTPDIVPQQDNELRFTARISSNDTSVATASFTSRTKQFGILKFNTYNTGHLVIQCKSEGTALIMLRVDIMGPYEPLMMYALKTCVIPDVALIDVSLSPDGSGDVVRAGHAVEPFLPDDDMKYQFHASPHHKQDIFYLRSTDDLMHGFDAEVYFDPAVINPNLTISEDMIYPSFPAETFLRISYKCLSHDKGSITSLAIMLTFDAVDQPVIWGWTKDCSYGVEPIVTQDSFLFNGEGNSAVRVHSKYSNFSSWERWVTFTVALIVGGACVWFISREVDSSLLVMHVSNFHISKYTYISMSRLCFAV